MSLRIRRADASEVVDLRHEVLRAGRPREEAVWDGDEAPSTRHWLALDRDQPVGVVSVFEAPEPGGEAAWQLRGMAVRAMRRDGGVGGAMLEAVHAEVAAPMWCKARERAVPFYARHGWQVTGERFEIAGIGPHFPMRWSP